MSKRIVKSKKTKPMIMVVTWVGALLSIALLFFTGSVLISDIKSMRSCNNNSALTVYDCGKQSLNAGDFMLFILFILAALLVVTLCTHAWQLTRGKHE